MDDYDKGIEYEFTLPDGTKRYEFVFNRRDVFTFSKMHGAVKAAPLKEAPLKEDEI